MRKFRILQLFTLLAIGLIGFDGYQDAAGHHDIGGQMTMCASNCDSHIVIPAVNTVPAVQQNHPYFIVEPILKSLQVTLSIFNPPKTLA